MPSYATPTDLTDLGIAPQALGSVSSVIQQKCLDAASALADGYLRSRFQLPLTAVSMDLKMQVCALAAYFIIKRRGFDPDSESDNDIREAYKEALKWLALVSEEKIDPGVTDSQVGGTFEEQGGPYVQTPNPDDSSDTASVGAPIPRGWGRSGVW